MFPRGFAAFGARRFTGFVLDGSDLVAAEFVWGSRTYVRRTRQPKPEALNPKPLNPQP